MVPYIENIYNKHKTEWMAIHKKIEKQFQVQKLHIQ